MTRPEQPQPYPGDLVAGGCRLRRVYQDPAGRPMTGEVTITGQTRTVQGDTVMLPAPVVVELVDGVLDVILPADTYQVEAELRTVERAKLTDAETVTLP